MSLQSQQCNLTLKGHIIDKDINESLSNATITIAELSISKKSDEKGNFVFNNICPGSYTIQVTHVHCQPFSKLYEVQKSLHIDVEMPHTIAVEGEAVVQATKEKLTTGMKMELSGTMLNAARGQNLAEALSKIAGITMLQTGNTVSKPVIHGLFGNRLLTISNGVRLEGQQWGNEHAPEVDPFLSDKIVVIKGVDELKYGSDAIGGVILIDPKTLITTGNQKLNIYTGFSTNNGLHYGSAIYDWKPKKKSALSYRVQGSFRKAGNAKTPHYRMNNTGLQEYNFSCAARWKKDNRVVELFASNFNTVLGIFKGSHIGNLTDLRNAIANDQPNEIFTGDFTYKIDRPRQAVNHQTVKLNAQWTKNKSKLNTMISFQRNKREEFDIVRSSTNKSPQLTLTINTLSEDINWESQRNSKSNRIIGGNGVQQFNQYDGRYIIPNYNMYNTGIYAIQKWQQSQWNYQAGVRADYKSISTRRQRFNGQVSNYLFDFITLATSGNVQYKFNEHLKTNMGISLSSRAPYVNELLSDGIHHGTATYEVGKIDLKAEKSVFANWNIRYSNDEKWFMDLSFHYNNINDFIYQQPQPSDPVLTIAGAFPKITWEQTNAVLYGADLNLNYQLAKNLYTTIKSAVLFARNQKTNDWIIGMPSNRVEAELSYQLPSGKKFQESQLTFGVNHVGRQARIPKNYLQFYDFKLPPEAYTIYHSSFSTQFLIAGKKANLILSAQNIFNKVYRDYQNTMRYFTDELGSNFSFKLHYTIF
jgi:iron complex outermembrane recepter protein